MSEFSPKEVIELITEKKIYFIEYEKQTLKLLDLDIEDSELAEEIVAVREGLVIKIDDIDIRLNDITAENAVDLPMLSDAIKNKCNFNQLDSILKEIFLASQELYQVLATIQKAEPMIKAKYEGMKKTLLEQIAANNTSKSANVHKYLSSTGFKNDSFSVLGEKYSKI